MPNTDSQQQPFMCTDSETRLLKRLRLLRREARYDQVVLNLSPLAIVAKRDTHPEQIESSAPAPSASTP